MTDYPVSDPPEDRCCQCGKDLQVDHEHRMITGGGRLEMDFGYGSPHDLRNFVVYICDDCVPVFINNCKTKVGEFSCMGYGQDKALTSNVVVDEQFSAKHRARLLAEGFHRLTHEEMMEFLMDPVDSPTPPSITAPDHDQQ